MFLMDRAARADGLITHRFPLDDYVVALTRFAATGPSTRSSSNAGSSEGGVLAAMNAEYWRG
jgi:hypothetical protein